ncbi:KEOPS complex subunit Pcc1 [Geoglobus sp.]
MLYTVRLEMDLKESEVIASALKPDDLEWARSKIENGKLIIEVRTSKIGALINAVEDFFMNIKSASSALNALERE